MCKSSSAEMSQKCHGRSHQVTRCHQMSPGLSGIVQLRFQLGQGRSSQGPCLEPGRKQAGQAGQAGQTGQAHVRSMT